MVPGQTLTAEGANCSRRGGTTRIAVFQPLATWDDAVRRELASLEARTGVRPVEFVLIDDVYGNAMYRRRVPAHPVPRDVPRRRDGLRRDRSGHRDRVRVRAAEPATAVRPVPAARRPAARGRVRRLLPRDARRRRRHRGPGAARADQPLREPLPQPGRPTTSGSSRRSSTRTPGCSPTPSTCRSRRPTRLSPSETPGDRIVHVHLGDSNRLLPGHGHLDWAVDLRRAAATIGLRRLREPRVLHRGRPGRDPARDGERLRTLVGA